MTPRCQDLRRLSPRLGSNRSWAALLAPRANATAYAQRVDSGKWRSPARALWAHGGALTSGSGGWAWYNGARLAAANQIVIVTMNYRLGPLGFLHPGDLNRDLGPGNLGILDVMLALEWTAWNIAAFGGDPETITVGGQSAGAHLAGLLAASSRTRSMVRRLILQSGGLTSKVPSPADATAVAREYFDVLGVDVADTSAVRALEESRFVEAYDSMIRQRAGSGIALPIGPTRATDAPWTDLSAALKRGRGLGSRRPCRRDQRRGQCVRACTLCHVRGPGEERAR